MAALGLVLEEMPESVEAGPVKSWVGLQVPTFECSDTKSDLTAGSWTESGGGLSVKESKPDSEDADSEFCRFALAIFDQGAASKRPAKKK